MARTPPATPKRGAEGDLLDLSEVVDVNLLPKKFCTRQNPTICKICKSNCIEKNITCVSCTDVYHPACVGVPDSFCDFLVTKNKMPWECPLCVMKSKEDTKLRSKSIDDKLHKLNKQMAVYEKRADDCELKLTSQASQMEMVLSMVSKSSEIQENRILGIEARLEVTDERLSKEICFMQGQHKIDELTISGIPYQQNENLKLHVINIAKFLGLNINSDGIKKIHRLTGQPEQNSNRIAPLMVKFISQDIRDAIFDKYIDNMKRKAYLTLSSINMSSNQAQQTSRIYINPRLPQCLQEVYQKALQIKKEGKIEAFHAKVNAVAVKTNGAWHKVQTMKELMTAINGKPLTGAD